LVHSFSTTVSRLDRDGGLIAQQDLVVSGQESSTANWRTSDTYWRAGRVDNQGFWIIQGRDGSPSWLRSFNFSNLGLDVSSEDQEILGTRDGGALFAASVRYLRSLAPDVSIWLVRLSQSGEIRWQTTLDGGEEERLVLHENMDGGFLVVSSSGYMIDQPATKLRLVRLNSAGDQIWDRWYGDSQYKITPRGVVENKDGSFLIAAEVQNLSDGTLSLLLLRTDRNGKVRGCSWLEDSPLRPPEEKIPDTTFGGWSDSMSLTGAFTLERTEESWLEISDAAVIINPLCVNP
jgi:hypothetical protein